MHRLQEIVNSSPWYSTITVPEGVYDIGNESIIVGPGQHLVGASENRTIIRYTGTVSFRAVAWSRFDSEAPSVRNFYFEPCFSGYPSPIQ